MLHYLRRLAWQLAWLPLCAMGACFPRNDRLWVFGAWHGQQYADNTRALFRHVNAYEPDLRAVWLTHNRDVLHRVKEEGGEAFMAYSLRGILVSLRARLFLVTHSAEDVNAHASLGGRLVNLTHGTPLKRFGRDAHARSQRIGGLTRLFDRYLRRLLPGKRSPDQVLVASNVGRERMASAYGLPSERVVALGYPRWDAFGTDAAGLLRNAGIETRAFAGVLLYAPTLRMQGKGGLDVAQGKRLEALLPWLERERLLLLVRGHASLKMSGIASLELRSDHVREVPVSRFPDVNALLPAVDVLLTDFSSLMFDYACLRRPIVLMAPDLTEYLHQDVGVYGDYFADAPGPVIEGWQQLPTAWREIQAGEHDDALARFVARHAALHDGRVCERITAHLRACCDQPVARHA